MLLLVALEIPVELFKILKDDAVKVLHSRQEKVSFHSNPKEGQFKECSDYCTVAFISHASKVILKILQTRFRQYVNQELPDVQVEFLRVRGTRDQIAICWIIEKAKEVP